MSKDEYLGELAACVEVPSLRVSHGTNSVDGASGPGWLALPTVGLEWAGPAMRGAAQPNRLAEVRWCRRRGDGYSEGAVAWIATAGEILAAIPAEWPEVTNEEIHQDPASYGGVPEARAAWRREKIERLRPRWEAATAALKAELAALPPETPILWDRYAW